MNRNAKRRKTIAFGLGAAVGFSLMLAACQEPRSAEPADSTTGIELIDAIEPADTIEALTADPERLAAVQEGCRTNQAWATAELCQAAAEARRRRFRGDGVPYTPRRVDPYPVEPTPTTPNTSPAVRPPQEPTAIPPSGPNL